MFEAGEEMRRNDVDSYGEETAVRLTIYGKRNIRMRERERKSRRRMWE